MTGDARGAQLLRRARSVLSDVTCRSMCYASEGHRADCIRGRAEKVVAAIDDHIAEQAARPTLGLRA
jgi:hypothetical protein